MLKNIILLLACAAMAVFGIAAFIIAQAEKQKAKKELNEALENEKRTVEVMAEANKKKSDARTGNHSSDINYIAQQLHDYAAN